MRGFCDQCGKPIAAKRYIKYCSDACKQKAYRRRHDALVGTPARNTERLKNAVRTKAQTLIEAVCVQCGQAFIHDGNQALQEYCSPACKQKAYRARKKEVSKAWAVGDKCQTEAGREAVITRIDGTRYARVDELVGGKWLPSMKSLKSLRPLADVPKESLLMCGAGPQGIQGLIDRLSVAYRERYGHAWIFEGAKVSFRDGAYFADVGDQAHYLNSFRHAKAALIDFYERGVMRWALVREGTPKP